MNNLYRPSVLAIVLICLAQGCSPGKGRDDRQDFRLWSAKSDNLAETRKLEAFLARHGVKEVIPTRQLLRSDIKWRACGAESFNVPPERYWPNMVPTLKLIRDEMQPLVGPADALSVFRSPAINKCIGGASRSYHLSFHAIDMQPAKGVSRDALIEKLCALHARKGKALNMGLGIYKGTRFHIDTAGYRSWGDDHHAGSSPCRS